MDECLSEYIATAEDSLKLLRELVDDIEAHHVRCNVVKTAGTTASVAGTVLTMGCVLAAPFTGGASIVGLTGVGMAAATVGAVTNLGTDVVDMIWTKKYHNELLAIDRRRERVAKRFFDYLDQIEAEAARIFKENGNEEVSLKEALELLITSGKIGWQGNKVTEIAANMGRTTSATLLRNGGKVWKGMRLQSNLLTSALKKMGLDVSKRAAFNAVKGATVVCGAVFIIWDLKSLTDSLNNNHPAAEAVEAQIRQIEYQLKNLKDLRDSFGG
jgi:hypothetical protein